MNSNVAVVVFSGDKKDLTREISVRSEQDEDEDWQLKQYVSSLIL